MTGRGGDQKFCNQIHLLDFQANNGGKDVEGAKKGKAKPYLCKQARGDITICKSLPF